MKKSPAADRTISMFGGQTAEEERPIEVLEPEERGERVTLEADADRTREKAFLGQEWTTKYFGKPEASGNEYRFTLRGEHYYLETLHKLPGSATAYGYSGLMVHESDLYNMARVIVDAVKDKQKKDGHAK